MESDMPIVLQAGASWCGPCQILKPMMIQKAKEFGSSVQYVYLDVDTFPELAGMLEI